MSHNVMRLQAFVDGTERTVVWRYDTTMPWTIRLIAPIGHATLVRFVARDLIWHGLSQPTGTRGVRVESGTESVRIRLHTGFRQMVGIEFRRSDVADALRTSYLMVPGGRESERYRWDQQLEWLCEDLGGVA